MIFFQFSKACTSYYQGGQQPHAQDYESQFAYQNTPIHNNQPQIYPASAAQYAASQAEPHSAVFANSTGYYYDANAQMTQMTSSGSSDGGHSAFLGSHLDAANNSLTPASNTADFYMFNNKQFMQQQYTNSMEYLSTLNSDQNEHLLNLVNSKKQEYAQTAKTGGYSGQPSMGHNMDSLVPSSSLASSSSVSSSAASSPLSHVDSMPTAKTKCALKRVVGQAEATKSSRMSRITAFNLTRANKKQKLSQQQQQHSKSRTNESDHSSPKPKLKQGLKSGDKKIVLNGHLKNSKRDKLAKHIKTEPSTQQQHQHQASHLPGEPKKRVSANKKERRRTQSINCAFEELRNRIPEIPHDTKLSKIKTLKLATEYIEHLMRLLEEGSPNNGPIEIAFKPDLGKLRRECRSKEIKVRYYLKLIL